MRWALCSVVVVFLFSFSSAKAAEQKVYDGIKPLELAALLRGMNVEVEERFNKVTEKSKTLDLRGSILYLRDCDSENRCRSGYLEIHSFGMNKNAWRLNDQHHSAVAFSPMYNRLRRPMTFVGVTKAYFKHVVKEEWAPVASAFGKIIRERLKKQK